VNTAATRRTAWSQVTVSARPTRPALRPGCEQRRRTASRGRTTRTTRRASRSSSPAFVSAMAVGTASPRWLMMPVPARSRVHASTAGAAVVVNCLCHRRPRAGLVARAARVGRAVLRRTAAPTNWTTAPWQVMLARCMSPALRAAMRTPSGFGASTVLAAGYALLRHGYPDRLKLKQATSGMSAPELEGQAFGDRWSSRRMAMSRSHVLFSARAPAAVSSCWRYPRGQSRDHECSLLGTAVNSADVGICWLGPGMVSTSRTARSRTMGSA
jgi:hypothetical protein